MLLHCKSSILALEEFAAAAAAAVLDVFRL
jgi:hypothetical protein